MPVNRQCKPECLEVALSSVSKSAIHRICSSKCWTIRVDSVITLDTKTDKDALSMKRAKCITSKTPPPPSASSTTSTAQFHPTAVPAPTSMDFLKIAQKAQVH
ncbi:hypothetical protein HAX54_002174 [Datura stramonium]|uniref:Uncharacterized protein n=1 Tax=Datura stramonium TaxID=4076 RepID=A0ABS8T4N4_DATST|nr:hypothetical protein [Datura stramonium]